MLQYDTWKNFKTRYKPIKILAKVTVLHTCTCIIDGWGILFNRIRGLFSDWSFIVIIYVLLCRGYAKVGTIYSMQKLDVIFIEASFRNYFNEGTCIHWYTCTCSVLAQNQLGTCVHYIELFCNQLLW